MLDLTKLLFGFILVDFIFVHFIILMLVFGILMLSVEQYLPAALRQSVRYGKHAFTGQTDKLVSLLEVPKSWFSHFYVFAAAYATLGVTLVFYVYFQGGKAPAVVMSYLDFVYGPNRSVKGERKTELYFSQGRGGPLANPFLFFSMNIIFR